MAAAMLDPSTWEKLCETEAYPALVETLKTTVYGPYLEAVADQNVTPRRAVYQMKKHLAGAFATVIGSAPPAARPLVTQVYRLYEVDNLKALLRGIASSASWDQIRYLLFPMNGFTVLPAQEIAEAPDIAAAIELLQGTPYHSTLLHAMERYTAEQSLFPLEVALDLDYWREMWRDINRLKGTDRTHARQLVGSLINMNNLMWAIRYRIYHHLSEEEIINYTLPFGYRVQDRDVRAIAAGADIAPIVARIYPRVPDPRALLQEPGDRLPELERQLQRCLARECRSAFLGYPFHIGIPLAYLLLIELEIQDLTVLIEAQSLEVAAETVRSHLTLGCTAEP